VSDEPATTLTDIAGNEIAPGDTVVYPQMSGRSVQMVLGTFQGYNGKTAKILRQEGSRWEAEHRTSQYRDKRTGKGIHVHGNGYKHFRVPPSSWYVHKDTGEKLPYDEYAARYHENPRDWDYRVWEYVYDRGVLHDYVEEYKPEPKPVTIKNVSNIVKVVASNAVGD
jgi:hypothetical protein